LSVLNALKWSFLGELASKAIQPVVFIVLARLLTPEDFGVMTAALMVIGFSQIFWEAGMGKALIQRQTDIEDAANAAFWINVGLGLLIAALLFLFAHPIGQIFFQDDRVPAVLQVMTLQVLLGALASVQTALLQKDMGFKKLFWVRFASVILPSMASIPLAWHGWGYWALVAGTLAGQMAQSIMLWRMSHWRPSLTGNPRVTCEMFKFGAWVGATGILTWFYAWADSLVVGHYLGTHDLGLFRTGGQLPAIVFAFLFCPVTPVLYSQLSRIGPSKEKIKQMAEIAIAVLTMVAIPVATILFVFSHHIEVLIFGEKWSGISVVLGVMALMHGFSWIVGMNGEFYRALGKPSCEAFVAAGILSVYLIVYLIVIQQGLNTFIWARMFLAMGALIFHLVFLKKILAVNLLLMVRRIVFLSIISAAVVFTAKMMSISIFENLWKQLIMGGIVSAFTALVVIYIIERKKVVLQIMAILRKK
jgi:O-antigen/teichoic acid export membrane protein